MELNFDKEMDALLRQAAAQQEKPVQPAAAAHFSGHLDADELAAFAGNALPVKARTRAMEHLVDCGNCRTVLSNLVFFENQPEESAAAAPHRVIAPVIATESASLLDRVRAFFTVPMLAYGMGGLVLIFTGLLVFSVYRGNQGDMQLAQSNAAPAEKSLNKGADQGGGQIPSAVPMADTNSSLSAANTAATANAVTSGAYSPYQPGLTANSAANAADSSSELAKSGAMPEPEAKPKEKREEDSLLSVAKSQQEAPAPVTRVDQAQNRQRNEILDEAQRGKDNYRSGNNILTPDGADRKRAYPPPASVSGAVAARDAERSDDADKNAPAAPTKKLVKGRQFRKDGAVWVDTAYRGQATVNIARESKEFKKLDDGLRKIAKEFTGAVIVVWKETAYRIQ